RIAHCGQVDDRGHTGKVLQQHAAGAERDLLFRTSGHVPLGHRLDVAALDEGAVLVAEQILEEDLETEREAAGVPAGECVERGKAEDRVLRAVDGERRAAAEGILACHGFVSRFGDERPPMRGWQTEPLARRARRIARLSDNVTRPAASNTTLCLA